MLGSPTIRTLALCPLMVGLWAAGTNVSAHTSVKAQATEGLTEDNALKIGHGCAAIYGGPDRPVIAQSVVFPGEVAELSASDGSTLADLSGVIEQGSLAGLFDTIQDKSIFPIQGEQRDANGNEMGFFGRNGKLDINFGGRVPFQVTAPNFIATSCVKRLLVEIAVADICDTSPPTIRSHKVNLWVPDNGSRFANQGAANGVEGIGEAATLIVNRDLIGNPLNAACGAGIDVTVTPTAADVNTYLPIPGYWR